MGKGSGLIPQLCSKAGSGNGGLMPRRILAPQLWLQLVWEIGIASSGLLLSRGA